MFVILWRFVVRPEVVDVFLQHYSDTGSWAQLFRRSPLFLGTDLIRSSDDATTFVTIDRWHSREAFEDFQREHGAEYARLDGLCEGLTLREELLGRYENID